jgi:hypothetical protein
MSDQDPVVRSSMRRIRISSSATMCRLVWKTPEVVSLYFRAGSEESQRFIATMGKDSEAARSIKFCCSS